MRVLTDFTFSHLIVGKSSELTESKIKIIGNFNDKICFFFEFTPKLFLRLHNFHK